MDLFLFFLFIALAFGFFCFFVRGPYKQSPLWLMFSAWMLALGVPRLNLSRIERPGSFEFWILVFLSLASFAFGFFVFKAWADKWKIWAQIATYFNNEISLKTLRIVIYILCLISLAALYLFYEKAGNFPLLDVSPDEFRFAADEKVPGLINYSAQLARLFVPLSFYLILKEGFVFKKHLDLVIINLVGIFALILFASRTQIYFIDLWVMALYLFIRKPDLKRALKFYPIFLLISVVVLSAIPLIRQAKSYGSDYLADITEIDSRNFSRPAKLLLPIYVGISFNMQALMHAEEYYQHNPLQKGKVSMHPFTNMLGLKNLKPEFDLGKIFKPWWNTGTYLFPFIQDFGRVAFFAVPFLFAGVFTILWKFLQTNANFLSINFYAYVCFFIVMSIYLSFTVRAEMYMDIFFIFLIYFLTKKPNTRLLDSNLVK